MRESPPKEQGKQPLMLSVFLQGTFVLVADTFIFV
jgi:hypothetical protein